MYTDFTIPVSVILDPPLVSFAPERMDQMRELQRYGLMYRVYDMIRAQEAPRPIGPLGRPITDVASVDLWLYR